jgi:hypothetical protein
MSDLAAPVSQSLDDEIDASLGVETISLRLPKELVDVYKLIEEHRDTPDYRLLMRDNLEQFVPEGLETVR